MGIEDQLTYPDGRYYNEGNGRPNALEGAEGYDNFPEVLYGCGGRRERGQGGKEAVSLPTEFEQPYPPVRGGVWGALHPETSVSAHPNREDPSAHHSADQPFGKKYGAADQESAYG